ncbi:MAG: hypothetical protein KME08_21065 [Aphanothece sp. CMT-3BRIN-NPC111]|jgi:hypothetical protein|nr:hypothetical protein [Aphanothece sp. CMT-3BRIN-NPC111]
MTTSSQRLETVTDFVPRAKEVLSDTEQPFSSIKRSGRLVCGYSGFLPCTQQTARHILTCEHLRKLPEEKLPPYRFEPQYTHQIWIWYRNYKDFKKLNLLFRGQFDFAILDREPDTVAKEVSDFLAYVMINSKNSRELLRTQYNDTFWVLAVETKLRRLLYSRVKE